MPYLMIGIILLWFFFKIDMAVAKKKHGIHVDDGVDTESMDDHIINKAAEGIIALQEAYRNQPKQTPKEVADEIGYGLLKILLGFIGICIAGIGVMALILFGIYEVGVFLDHHPVSSWQWLHDLGMFLHRHRG